MEDPLAGADAQFPPSGDGARLGFLAVLVASDVRARRAARDEVVAVWVLDLADVLPSHCVLTGGCD